RGLSPTRSLSGASPPRTLPRPKSSPAGSRRPSRARRAIRLAEMATLQQPLALRRDLVRIFGEDRLVAVIRTATPEIAERAARAVAEAGVRLVEITLTVPDAYELIAKLATDDAFAKRGAIVGAGTVLSGIGGPLIRGELLERGDHAGLVANAKRFLAATRRA